MRNDWVNQLPDTIRVGHRDFTIKKMSPAWASDTGDSGEFCGAQEEIRIQANMPSRHYAVEVVLHEVAHAIFDMFGLDADSDEKITEERAIHAMGCGWTQVFRDNPELLEWITETLHEEEDDE